MAASISIRPGLSKLGTLSCSPLEPTKFTIHILAAVAEHERDAISPRTRSALAAAKANGKKLGNYQRIAQAQQRATAARAEAVRPAIAETMRRNASGSRRA